MAYIRLSLPTATFPTRPLLKTIRLKKKKEKKRSAYILPRTHVHARERARERHANEGREFFNVGNDGRPHAASNISRLVSKWAERLRLGRTIANTSRLAHVCAVPRDYCNFAIFQQDKGLLISQRVRAALPSGTLRERINAALTSRLRDYPNYSSAWDLMQVRTLLRADALLPTNSSEPPPRRELCEYHGWTDWTDRDGAVKTFIDKLIRSKYRAVTDARAVVNKLAGSLPLRIWSAASVSTCRITVFFNLR